MKHGFFTALAVATGLSVQSVYAYCHGRIPRKFERAETLAKATGTDPLLWVKGDKIQLHLNLKNCPLNQG